MTGAYLKVKRDNKWCNIEVEHLTNDEREAILKDDPRLMKWLHVVCQHLVDAETTLDNLVKEGILTKE